MVIIDLSAKSAKQFVRQQPVSVILFYSQLDVGIHAILDQFVAVAETFGENIGFGRCDISAPNNAELFDEASVVATPTVIYYQFAIPRGEDVGLVQIQRSLDHESIVHNYGVTASGLRLTR